MSEKISDNLDIVQEINDTIESAIHKLKEIFGGIASKYGK